MRHRLIIQIWYEWALYYVPTKPDDPSHIDIQHFFLFRCWNPEHGYDSSPWAGIGTQAMAQPYHSQHSHVGFSLDCWGSELSAWHAGAGSLYFIHTTYLYSCDNNSFTDRNCFPEIPLKHNQPRPTHFMSSPLGKGTLRQFLSHCDWPHRSSWP